MKKQLDPFEVWAVKNHLKEIRRGNTSLQEGTSLLRANGYHRIAQAVAEHYAANKDLIGKEATK